MPFFKYSFNQIVFFNDSFSFFCRFLVLFLLVSFSKFQVYQLMISIHIYCLCSNFHFSFFFTSFFFFNFPVFFCHCITFLTGLSVEFFSSFIYLFIILKLTIWSISFFSFLFCIDFLSSESSKLISYWFCNISSLSHWWSAVRSWNISMQLGS